MRSVAEEPSALTGVLGVLGILGPRLVHLAEGGVTGPVAAEGGGEVVILLDVFAGERVEERL